MLWFTGKDAVSAADIAAAHETQADLAHELEVAQADIANLKAKLSTARIVSSATRAERHEESQTVISFFF